MKKILLSLALVAFAGTAQAECYADYKAKQDDPLRLHYGVAQISGPCPPRPPRRNCAAVWRGRVGRC